jgi:hypothetical protein
LAKNPTSTELCRLAPLKTSQGNKRKHSWKQWVAHASRVQRRKFREVLEKFYRSRVYVWSEPGTTFGDRATARKQLGVGKHQHQPQGATATQRTSPPYASKHTHTNTTHQHQPHPISPTHPTPLARVACTEELGPDFSPTFGTLPCPYNNMNSIRTLLNTPPFPNIANKPI